MIIFLFILLNLSMPQAWAQTNYQEISIEEKIRENNDAKMVAASQQTQNSIESFEQEKQTIAQQLAIITGDEDTKYIIVPGDTLQVVYSDRGTTVENIYQVNSDGMIGMPLIGQVKLSGMNRGQARERLNQLMMEYIRNPQMSIDINTAGKYTVMGAAGPGVYELQPNLKLMEALIKAGLNPGSANLADILVFRQGDPKPQMLRLNIKKMMLRGDISDNIAIKPNDIIYVPTTLLHNLSAFKDMLFEYLTDYYTLGGATILKSSATKGF